MVTRVIIGVVLIIFVGLGTSLTLSNMKLSRLEKENKKMAQSLVDKDEEIRAIGVAVNNELKRVDNDSKNEIIRNDNTLRTGIRRVR